MVTPHKAWVCFCFVLFFGEVEKIVISPGSRESEQRNVWDSQFFSHFAIEQRPFVLDTLTEPFCTAG